MDTQNNSGQSRKKFPTKLELMGLVEEQNKNPENSDVLFEFSDKQEDAVNHPSHYTAYKGLEVIDLTEQMNFNRGNAVKYIARAGLKDSKKEVEDLEKAAWYIRREIERLRDDESQKEKTFANAITTMRTGLTPTGRPACMRCHTELATHMESKLLFCPNFCPNAMG